MAASMQWDLIPGVAARVFAHELRARGGSVPCFTYVTDGLRAFRQREIVFTLQRAPNAPIQQAPQEPLHFLRAIADLARQGRIVEQGGVTELGANGLFNVPALRGVAYQTAWPMEGVEIPPGSLSAVALVAHEMEIAKRFGTMRVLARLGRTHDFFPTAVWCVPNRAPMMPPEAKTILEGVASAHFTGVSAVLEGERILVRVARSTIPTLADAIPRLPPEAAMAIFTTLDESADACLVWNSGQQAPEAITPPGSRGQRVSGCFALFVPQQSADGGNPFEDGFAFMLTDPAWAHVRQSLATGWPTTIPPRTPGAKALVLEWYDASIPAASAPFVSEMRMVLRENQSDIEQRLGMQALVPYAEAIERTVQEHFANERPQGAALDLDVLLSAGRPPAIRVMCWPEPPSLAILAQRLSAIPGPPIRFGEIAFRGSFALFGGPPARA